MKYQYVAEMAGNVVVRVLVCDNCEWASSTLGGQWLPVYESNYCGIGWTWAGAGFIPPIQPILEEE